MSGPKIDAITLEKRRKEALENQREERTQAYMRLQETLRQRDDSISQIKHDVAKRLCQAEPYETLKENCERLKKAAQDACDCLRAIQYELPDPSDHNAYMTAIESVIQRIKGTISGAYGSYHQRVDAEKNTIHEYLKNQKQIQIMEEIPLPSHDKLSLQARIKALQQEQANRTSVPQEATSSDWKERIGRIVAVADELLASDQLLSAQRKELQEGKEKLHAKLHGQKDDVEEDIRRLIDCFEDISATRIAYDELCALCQLELHEFPKPLQEFDDLYKLKGEIANRKVKVQRRNERLYIQQAIWEVLEKHGYCQRSPLDIGTKATEEHYLVLPKGKSAQGQQPVLHMYSKNDRRTSELMIEVANVRFAGRSVRKDKKNIGCRQTGKCAAADIKQQITFCNMHKEIIEELGKKGVNLENVKHISAGEEQAEIALTSSTTEAFSYLVSRGEQPPIVIANPGGETGTIPAYERQLQKEMAIRNG